MIPPSSSSLSTATTVCPPQNIKSDLRPIALTSCLAKVLEGFTNKRLFGQESGTIEPRKYARHGHSTVHALIYLMQAIHEAVDSGKCSVRIFFADFTKGFDIIDHPILPDELRSFNIDQTPFFLDSLLPYQPNTSSARQLLSVIMETSQWWRSTGSKTLINALCYYGKQAALELAYAYEVSR